MDSIVVKDTNPTYITKAVEQVVIYISAIGITVLCIDGREYLGTIITFSLNIGLLGLLARVLYEIRYEVYNSLTLTDKDIKGVHKGKSFYAKLQDIEEIHIKDHTYVDFRIGKKKYTYVLSGEDILKVEWFCTRNGVRCSK